MPATRQTETQRKMSAGNETRPSALSRLERETMHQALAIVKGLRGYVRQHFHPDAL
jgi:signal-transduction protein with cAMP-binding, CBS, and nucleotidyltransferase domain